MTVLLNWRLQVASDHTMMQLDVQCHSNEPNEHSVIEVLTVHVEIFYHVCIDHIKQSLESKLKGIGRFPSRVQEVSRGFLKRLTDLDGRRAYRTSF